MFSSLQSKSVKSALLSNRRPTATPSTVTRSAPTMATRPAPTTETRIFVKAALRAAHRLAASATVPSLSLSALRTTLRASAASGPSGIAAASLAFARAANERATLLGVDYAPKPEAVAFTVGSVLRRNSSGMRCVVVGYNTGGLAQPTYLVLLDMRDAWWAAQGSTISAAERTATILQPALLEVAQSDLLPLPPGGAPTERIVLHPWLGRYFEGVAPELGCFKPNSELALLYPDDALSWEARRREVPLDASAATEACSLLEELNQVLLSGDAQGQQRTRDAPDSNGVLPSPGRGRTRSA